MTMKNHQISLFNINSTSKLSPKLRYLMLISVLLFTGFASLVHAVPTVVGNTIKWPDDGWYQVDNKLTREIECQGGTECTVLDGIYWVNRFNEGRSSGWRVIVGNPPELNLDGAQFADTLSIDGNTLTWSVGGWYQVQDGQTYQQICNGTDSCSVPRDGQYIVINHSLGLRTRIDVLANGIDGNDSTDDLGTNNDSPYSNSRPTVVGNTITWPDDGWYQVDNKLTREIECQGGRECTVPDGIYWVNRFNEGRSSGWRIIVGIPSELSIDSAEFANTLRVDGNTITWSVGGWYQVQDGRTYQEICNGTDSCSVPIDGQYIVLNHSLGLRTRIDVAAFNAEVDGDSKVDVIDETTADSQVQATLELITDKTFRISWQPSINAEFYRVLENPDGLSGFTQISDDLEPSTQRLDHRVALYSKVNARYIVQACNASQCVDSNELVVSGSLEAAIGYLKASNTNAGDEFGRAVSLSADGNTLAVGVYGESSSATGVNGNQYDNATIISGAVYVFTRINDVWQQQAYLKASNADQYDYFGWDVSLNADGNTLAIGAFYESSAATGVSGSQNDNSAFKSGAVYVFVDDNGNWQQQAYLKASNTDPDDEFGFTINLSADGNTLAVGAPREQSAAMGITGNQLDNTADVSGAVYVFARLDGNWQQQAYLKGSNTGAGDYFGYDVSLGADGDTLAVGAVGEDSTVTGTNSNQDNNNAENAGAVYVFIRRNDNWQQQTYLKASNTDAWDRFGNNVSLSADGNTLAVGAYWEDSSATGVNNNQNDNSSDSAGAVYVFTHDNGNWQQQSYIKASNTDFYESFGHDVSLSADGETLAVGALYEDSNATGIDGRQDNNVAASSGAVYFY